MEESPHQEGPVLLTKEDIVELENLGHVIHRTAGHPFFLEGEPGTFALLIQKGHAKIMRGKPPRIIDVRKPGDIVGEMAVISNKPRMASVVAFDDVEALYLPGAKWLTFLYAHPRAMHALLVATDAMVDRAVMRTIESELAIEQQVAKRLLELVGYGVHKSTGTGAMNLRLSQQDLAALIGAKKLDSVKKIIARLKASGIVATGRQSITILQLDKLRDVAHGDLTVS
jgi:CRP-like cAMP-binding protein